MANISSGNTRFFNSKNIMQYFVLFLVLMSLFGFFVQDVQATDNYTLSIETIDLKAPSNLLNRYINIPTTMSNRHENVQIEKYCYVGETISLTAIVIPSNAYVGEVIWTIEQDSQVAKIVSTSGLSVSIKGVSAGTCTIVCKAADNQGAYTTCKLTVYQYATDIVLDPNVLTIAPGESKQIVATVLPDSTTDKTIAWSSSDESIATVDENGVVTGVSDRVEPVTITCMALDGSGVIATAKVYVHVLVTDIQLEDFDSVIYKKGNNTEIFKAVVYPDNATVKTLNYTSSNPAVATVVADKTDNNSVIISPHGPGKFILTCSATDMSGVKRQFEIEVIQLVEYVALNEAEKVLFLNKHGDTTYQLEVVTALPENANLLTSNEYNKFVWTSSDEAIASVDETGLVTAHTTGVVTITATANDAGLESASCVLRIRNPVTDIAINLWTFEYVENSASLAINLIEKQEYINNQAFVYAGDEMALHADINTDATLKDVIWQVAGKGILADGSELMGIYARVADSYINPTILTGLPINNENEDGYLTILVSVKAVDGSGASNYRLIQIRQPATEVKLNKSSAILHLGDPNAEVLNPKSTITLTATVLPDNAFINKNPNYFPNGKIEWSSSDEAIATVDQNGVVTATGIGEATIYAKSADGHGMIGSCDITVLQPIESLKLYAYSGDEKIEIKELDENGQQIYYYAYTNQEIRLYPEVSPVDASNKNLTWTSSNTNFVTVENGYLKIGKNITSDGVPVTIICSSTDGSGKKVEFKLCILSAEYEVSAPEFLNVTAGNIDQLRVTIMKNELIDGKVVQKPVEANIEISLNDNQIDIGGKSEQIIKLFHNGWEMPYYPYTFTNLFNPTFEVLGQYNGIVMIKFVATPKEFYGSIASPQNLIGNPVKLEKTCVINITGNDIRTVTIAQKSINVRVGQSKQVNAIISPANAKNCYLEYSLEKYNDDYANIRDYAEIDSDTGVIKGKGVGVVYAVATLKDSETNEVIVSNDKEQIAKVPVYITESLEGVSMSDVDVYVGDEVNLLPYVHLSPESLNHSIDKTSVVRFNVISGSSCIEFLTTKYGAVKGLEVGTVTIEAIVTSEDKTITSNVATINVRNRLTGINLPSTYSIRINQVIKLIPQRTPYNGDLSNTTITWKSSNPSVAKVTSNLNDNYGFEGIVTGLKEGKTDITVTIKTDKKTLTGTTTVTVIPLSVDDFSGDQSDKNYEFDKNYAYRDVYRYGAYHLKDSGGNSVYAAGCLENGMSSLSTVQFNATKNTNTYSYTNTWIFDNDKKIYVYSDGVKNSAWNYISYPKAYSLKTFRALEAVSQELKEQSVAMGFPDTEEGFNDYLELFNESLQKATVLAGRADKDAYIDLPGKSHVLVRNDSGTTYTMKSDFKEWGHKDVKKSINILTGLTSFVKEGDSPEEIIDKVKNTVTTVNGDWTGLENSYFTSALTSLNVFGVDGAVSNRMANGLSILMTYFPLDDARDNISKLAYAEQHAARQMMIWSIAGLRIPETYYNQLMKMPDANLYLQNTPSYSGANQYYGCFMIQSADHDSANYMDYPFGYSAFYHACKDIVGGDRNRINSEKLPEIMNIIEGFTWKMDQCKDQTRPSFTFETASEASDSKNAIQLYYSDGAYKTTLIDTNGVLNYYKFSFKDKNNKDLITFTNNGDGTLSIVVPKANVDKVKELQKERLCSTKADFIPADNKYVCAAFVKHEMEGEVVQMPFTRENGTLGYAYLLGANVQSQVIKTDIESDLGDPFEAYMTFAFNDSSEYDSVVESDVILLDAKGNVSQYIIPGEQYQLKYVYKYEGKSRNLKLVDTNTGKNKKVSNNVYAFASDLRARTGTKYSLLELVENNEKHLFAKIDSTSTITDSIWKLEADKVPVTITGSYTVYPTPEANEYSQSWDSGTLWSDTLYIDSNVGEAEVKTEEEIKNSSKHPGHITVEKTGENVIITWTYYTGLITFTTPYVYATAEITIDADTTHPVEVEQNFIPGDKYLYGLTINGNSVATIHETESSDKDDDVTQEINTPFEYSVVNSTGYATFDMELRSANSDSSNSKGKVIAGRPFRILDETGEWWHIEYEDKTGYVRHNYCMINLPDVMPSIIYEISNAQMSIYKSNGTSLPGITGSTLYSVPKVESERFNKAEYIVPVLYSTAKKVAEAQKLAKADGYSLKIYDAYRPKNISERIASALTNLYNSNATVKAKIDGYTDKGSYQAWGLEYFAENKVSPHNVGAAIDVTLVNLATNNEVIMPTAMHELSTNAVKYYNPTVAMSPDNYSSNMNTMAKRLNDYFDQVNLQPNHSEWWHFQDQAGFNRIKSVINDGCNFQVSSIVSTKGQVVTNNGSSMTPNEYIESYAFTGMVANAVKLINKTNVISVLPKLLFNGKSYRNDENTLADISLSDLLDIANGNKGSNQSNEIGDVHFFYSGTSLSSDTITGVAINIGKHNNTSYCVYALKNGNFMVGTKTAAFAYLGNTFITKNFEEYVFWHDGGEMVDGEGEDGLESTATLIKIEVESSNFYTEIKNTWNSRWAEVKSHLDDFTMTNAYTYGGSGYLNADFSYVEANNAQNYTSFHTDKTFKTVFDLKISDLVVNTGAGITSPTSIDTRNFVNLNVYYTVKLTNDAYQIITNRYGKVSDVWWHYYKDTYENGKQEEAAHKYIYKKTSFWYNNASGQKVYCTAQETPVSGRTYYYNPNADTERDEIRKGIRTSMSYPSNYPDSQSHIRGQANFIPDNFEHIFYATKENLSGNIDTAKTKAWTRPAGYAEENTTDVTIHTDVFTEFCIYDNAYIADELNRLKVTTFPTMTDAERLEAMNNSGEPSTTLSFIDNIQTGENYIQHSVPYVLTATESGIKVFGFAAYVNTTHNGAPGFKLDDGTDVYTNHALAEWGEPVSQNFGDEPTYNSKPAREHYAYADDYDASNPKFFWNVDTYDFSLLKHKIAVRNKDRALGIPVLLTSGKNAGKYKYYHYMSEYYTSYGNNATSTYLLQYPSYNPYTLSTVSFNGSLVYESHGISGFNIQLSNNQMIHIPNIDTVSYIKYDRRFNTDGVMNAGLLKNTWGIQYMNGGNGYTKDITGRPFTINFQYNSLNFFKYSPSNHKLYKANGANVAPSDIINVNAASAKTELVNETETESLVLTKILFRSSYTTTHNYGEDGWVDITDGQNKEAIVNAGKGFELRIEVTYTNTNLTDYLVRYLKDSAQVAGNTTSSGANGIVSSGCNISPLTGQYGQKSPYDKYTATVQNGLVNNDVFGSNVYQDIYVVMNNNNKYVYSYSGVYGSTQVFNVNTDYNFNADTKRGEIVMTYDMKNSNVNGFYNNEGSGLSTQSMKFYTDISAAGTSGSLTVWTNPIAATPFGYPGNMRDRYLADLKQIHYYIVEPVDNVDNIVQ